MKNKRGMINAILIVAELQLLGSMFYKNMTRCLGGV